MDDQVKKLIHKLKLYPKANIESIHDLQKQLNISFPEDYKNFLLETNGAEGTIGNSYIILWSIADLLTLNNASRVKEYAPGLFLIGSDGGDTGYALDLRNNIPDFVEVPFVGMNLDEIKYCARDFIGFLEYLLANREKDYY